MGHILGVVGGPAGHPVVAQVQGLGRLPDHLLQVGVGQGRLHPDVDFVELDLGVGFLPDEVRPAPDFLEVYQALVDAGASEEKARAAAEAIPDMSELADKNDLAGVRSELKQDIADLRSELKQDIADLRSELKQEIADLRSELKRDIVELRSEFRQDIAELRSEFKQDIVGLKADLYKHMWLMQGATILAIVGLLKLLP